MNGGGGGGRGWKEGQEGGRERERERERERDVRGSLETHLAEVVEGLVFKKLITHSVLVGQPLRYVRLWELSNIIYSTMT